MKARFLLFGYDMPVLFHNAHSCDLNSKNSAAAAFNETIDDILLRLPSTDLAEAAGKNSLQYSDYGRGRHMHHGSCKKRQYNDIKSLIGFQWI